MATDDGRRHAIAPRFHHPTGRFAAYPAADLDCSIPELVARRARERPDAVAMRTPTRAATYGELHAASGRVARAILGRAGSGNEPVAVMLDLGVPLVAAALGVLRAGKILVVLDPAHPPARNAAVLHEAEPALLLVDHRSAAAAPAGGWPGPRLDVDAIEPGGADGPDAPSDGNTLAAIVFTSGTAGRPKGVLHDHRSLCHLIRELTNALRLTPEDRVALLHPLTGIAGFRTVWTGLLTGATLCELDVARHGAAALVDWLRAERISFYFSTPTLFRHMAASLGPGDRLPDIRAIRLGGEPVSRSDFELYCAHFGAHAALLVTYNASEVSTIAWRLYDAQTAVEGDALPVGFAREGTEIRLLDADGRPAAPGAVGEIALRSRYMSRGYWRHPELTAERFLVDPDGGGERMYRTGDLGRFLPDGALVHLGRGDAQVKVRGFRVETGEVEAALMDDPGIKHAAVVLREGGGERRLVAYVVASRSPGPSLEAIRRRLQDKLPAHMIPPAIVVLDAMPLNPSGKVARSALPDPGRGRPPLAQPFVRARTPLEELIADVWRDVLQLDAVGVHDRFLDLGGTSLRAGAIAARVQAAVGADVATTALLDAGTVADMALAVSAALATRAPDLLERLGAEADEPGAPAP